MWEHNIGLLWLIVFKRILLGRVGGIGGVTPRSCKILHSKALKYPKFDA